MRKPAFTTKRSSYAELLPGLQNPKMTSYQEPEGTQSITSENIAVSVNVTTRQPLKRFSRESIENTCALFQGILYDAQRG